MNITKLVAQKVCHAICHMNYPIVVNQAIMDKDEVSFQFDTIYNTHIHVIFADDGPNRIAVYKKTTNEGSSIYWETDWTIDDIADEIVQIAQSFNMD